MASLGDLKNFDVTNASVSLWVFRSTACKGVPSFRGRWVDLTDALESALKESFAINTQRIEETICYSVLAQNHEASALTISSDETYAHLIVRQSADKTPGQKIKQQSELENINFYAIRFNGHSGTLYAIRKADSSWKIRRAKGILKIFFADDQLDVDRHPSFNVSPQSDFYILNDSIFIASKPSFESVLSYRQGHVDAFNNLKIEDEFTKIFSDIGPINEYVGNNKTQLRRAIAIREKGYYRDPNFMKNLREKYVQMQLSIEFNADGRIVPTLVSCKDIFQALLDHRLISLSSESLYDVQNTEPVL